jgi:maleate isomerase
MRFPALTVEGLVAMGDETKRAAEELAEINASAVCFCSTSGSFVKGMGYDTELMERIRSVTGVPAVATSPAVVEALRTMGITKVAIASPHGDQVNQLAGAFLEGNGIQVVGMKGLGLGQRPTIYPYSKGPIPNVGVQEPSVAYCLARDAMTPEAEGVLITCTNFRSIDVLDLLEQDLGVPVISANQATFWAAMRTAGIREGVSGYGSLLRRMAG